MLKRKRLLFAIFSAIIISWIYYGPIQIYVYLDGGSDFSCEPLGRPPGSGRYTIQHYPDNSQSSEFKDYVKEDYGHEAYGNEWEKEDWENDLSEELHGWEYGCQMARDNRRVTLNIALVTCAVIFLSLPKDPKKPKKPRTSFWDLPDDDPFWDLPDGDPPKNNSATVKSEREDPDETKN